MSVAQQDTKAIQKIFEIGVDLWPGCVTNRTVMDTMQNETDLGVEVKARVPRKLKRILSRMAKRRMLSTSDLVREALADFLKRQGEAR